MAALKNAGEILEELVEEGRTELDRASVGLALSGLAAGLNISFSAMALAFIGSLTGGIGLLAYAVYPVGFLLIILGQAELFTEHTVPPVVVALSDRSQILNTLRLWVVIFIFNVVGAIAFAFVVSRGEILSPAASDLLIKEVAEKMEPGFWAISLKAVFGGWLVALVAWLVAASQDTVSQILITYLLVILIPVAGLAHCIAGSGEVLVSVFAGNTTWFEYLGDFLLPATIGNAAGGVVLVTLLNYGQVIGSKIKARGN